MYSIRHRALLIFAIACLALSALAGWSAVAHATVYSGNAQAWFVDLDSRVPLPAGEIEVTWRTCDAGGACTFTRQDGSIEITMSYVSRYTALHELGHAFDVRNLNTTERSAIGALLNPNVAWDDCGPLDDRYGLNGCPRERFADTYANCAAGMKTAWVAFYGHTPTKRVYRKLCRLIRASASAN